MKINNYLNKLGYRPDLSDGVYDKYEKALNKYLKDIRYQQFCSLRESASTEEDIINFIGDDIRLLKLVSSSQLKISIVILEEVINTIRELDINPINILDLGGSDGWACNYLIKHFNPDSTVTVVDKNTIYEAVSENIEITNTDYSSYVKKGGHDLIISILGAPYDSLSDLYKCISQSLSENGKALLGLRISSISDYIESINIANNFNLKYEVDYSKRLQIFDEHIPFICITKSNQAQTDSEKLLLSREGFMNYSNPKRVYGYEAQIFEKLLKEAEILSMDTIEFDNGIKFHLDIFKMNDIVYRKTYNTYGDLLIEYPVNSDDKYNNIQSQLERFHNESLWNNSL